MLEIGLWKWISIHNANLPQIKQIFKDITRRFLKEQSLRIFFAKRRRFVPEMNSGQARGPAPTIIYRDKDGMPPVKG